MWPSGAGETPYARMRELRDELAREQGYRTRIDDLIALTRGKDPYYAGAPADVAKAEWFAEILGDRRGVHLRRLHYGVVAPGDVLRPDGVLYENNTTHWNYLNQAARMVRYLGLVDPEAIVDQRNPQPHVYMAPSEAESLEPEWSYETSTDGLDRISTLLSNDWTELLDVQTEVGGYVYEQDQQPYQCEVWSEKSTQDDILVPLCRELGTNYVSGSGYLTITAVVRLLRRMESLGKPCRVFYVSDYDKSGSNMPIQMARQAQYWMDAYGLDLDLRVEPIVMTREQAADYPAAPDSGAVELDAMEVYTPGRLDEIVSGYVSQFRDFELEEKVEEAERRAEEHVETATQDAISEEALAIEAIKGEAEQIYERYRPRLRSLARQLELELAPLDARLETSQQAATQKLAALEDTLELPDMPEGEPDEEPEDSEWLFQSERSYMEQLAKFKEQR